MLTISTDSTLSYDALITPRSDKALGVALVASVFLHAVAITLLPGMRALQPALKVFMVEIERPPPPLAKVEQKPTPKQTERNVEKPFVRQDLQETPRPTEAPQPKSSDPRRDVAVVPRTEPLIEHSQQIPEPVTRAERQPLPDVQPTPQPLEPRVVPKPEQRPAPVATPRAEPILESQRPQTSVAPATSGPIHPTEQALPRPEQIAERKPQAITAPPEARPTAPTQSAQLASTRLRLELSRNDIAPVVSVPQVVPQPPERRIEPPIAGPGDGAPEVRRQMRPEPTIQARAPTAQESAPVVAPPQQARPRSAPKITAPTTAGAMPSAPKRNKLDVEAVIQRFAAEISRQMEKGVSERDYPRLARDRGWQGTTHLLLHISADGQLGEITVATSSGFDILDTRAIELVKRVKLPSMPADIESQAFTVRIPVRFALRE
jgi:periplasmic protein TonB